MDEPDSCPLEQVLSKAVTVSASAWRAHGGSCEPTQAIALIKTLRIVGGSSGIGAATLDLALLRGHRVIQASRHPERVRVAPEVTSLEWDACGGDFPVQSLPDVLDGLVYCPGGIRLKPFARLRAAEFREDLEVSLIGAARAVQAALPALKRGQASSYSARWRCASVYRFTRRSRAPRGLWKD